MLMRLQSPRTANVRELVREGSSAFGLAGETEEAAFRLESEGAKVKASVDGQVAGRRADFMARSELVVWMGTSDLQLVRGGGSERRRYLDFLAAQIDPEYRLHWSRYRKVLQVRNRALKSGASAAELRAYTNLLITHGEELRQRRGDVCEQLRDQVRERHQGISQTAEDAVLRYQPREKDGLREAFERLEENERRRGVTLAGPHRDEVELTLCGRAAKAFGSEGQQRTLALALKLAQGDVLKRLGGKTPLYLVDDVFGELDRSRRHALLQQLPTDAQKLTTTTNLDWFDSHAQSDLNPGQIWQVMGGTVVASE